MSWEEFIFLANLNLNDKRSNSFEAVTFSPPHETNQLPPGPCYHFLGSFPCVYNGSNQADNFYRRMRRCFSLPGCPRATILPGLLLFCARSTRSATCLYIIAPCSRGAPRSPWTSGLYDYWTTAKHHVQRQHSHSSRSCLPPRYACSSSVSMEYLGTSKLTPPAVTQTACTGLPVHSASEIPSAPAVRRQTPSYRQSSNSSIWSSHLTLLHSRRHD
jgi:hypothetical protein